MGVWLKRHSLDRPVRAAGAGHPLAGRLLRVSRLPDVHRELLERVAGDGLHVLARQLHQLHRRARPVRAVLRPLDRLRGAATLLTFLIAYPLAYTIAFKGGRQKNLLLFLVVAPFFTSFLLRTISLEDHPERHGLVLGPLKAIGLLPRRTSASSRRRSP